MMKLQKCLIAACASVLLSGCQTTIIDSCDGWKPLRPRSKDVLVISEPLARQIAAHNEHGKRDCGWKP